MMGKWVCLIGSVVALSLVVCMGCKKGEQPVAEIDVKAELAKSKGGTKVESSGMAAALQRRTAIVKQGVKAVPALIEGLGDPDKYIRAEAATILGEIGPDAKEAVPKLVKCMKSEEKFSIEQSCAAEALGKIGPTAKEAISALQEAAKSDDFMIREAAQKSLQQISGQKD